MDLFWRKHGEHKLLYQLYCVFVTALTTAVSVVLSLQLHRLGLEKENLLMVFLVGVLLTTVFTRGYIYGFLSSAASIFLFDYYFTSPVFTFIISNKQDLVLLLFFLIAALISGMRLEKHTSTKNSRLPFANVSFSVQRAATGIRPPFYVFEAILNTSEDFPITMMWSSAENT